MEIVHVPVMLEEVVDALKVKKKGIYIDATVGLGGHAEEILRRAEGECILIGIDQDEEAIHEANKSLKGYPVHMVRENFANMVSVTNRLGYEKVDGILLDLGTSALQLKAEGRGFSFVKDDPLDMRMDGRQTLTAEKIVNEYPEKDLAQLLWQYGEERFSRRIARAIVTAREKGAIRTCRELAGIIDRAVRRGRKYHFPGRIHPATRTFQALRIEVNKELTMLTMAMEAGITILKKEGRFCVLSYHSLEDRIVKRAFRKMADEGLAQVITKKPIVPGREERNANPSSRSAKLRVAEKL
jgi:16S rRNA (cytosine1402-N4)-methyltransferase